MGTSLLMHVVLLLLWMRLIVAQTVDVSFTSSVVAVDSFTTATCIVSGTTTQIIQSFRWERDGTVIVSSARITVTDESDRSTLEIEEANSNDAGEYSCIVIFVGGGSIADSATLQIATELVLTADLEQEFPVRTTATLRCSANSIPAPRITWLRIVGGNEVELIEQRSNDPDFGVYTIPDVEQSDAGTYRCRARNSLVPSKDVDIELIVLVPPQIVSSMSTQQVMSGINLTIFCNATGMRPPTYHWLHNNLNIADIAAEDDRITANNMTGLLIIRDITFADAGNYTCVATNSAGSDRQDHKVTVVGPPDIILDPDDPQRNIRVAEGIRVVLDCPFLSNPPPEFTRWRNPSDEIIVESEGSRFQDFPNGTLIISEVRSQDSGTYTCEIRNAFGMTTYTYDLIALEKPGPPRFLVSTDHPDDERAVTLSWQHPASISPTSEVEKYFVELSFDDRGFLRSEQSFLGNETSGELLNLLPGENYEIRLRACNLAGIGNPSNVVIHMPPAKSPNLAFFNATALEDGRSVLLEWELEFDGGSDITEFRVEVSLNGVRLFLFNLNISLEEYEVIGLNPLLTYQFNAFLSNEQFPEAIRFTTEATTPLAFPDKPTTPTITSVTTHSITVSFTVRFGSRRITHFVVNITEVDSSDNERGFPTQEVIPADEVRYVESLVEVLNEEDEAIGFEVLLVITTGGHGLRERGTYVFEVAATSTLGTGRFSNPSEPATLEDDRILYYIIAGIVGGVLLIVGLILLAVVIKVCINRYRKRKQRLTINSNGSYRAQLTQDPYTDKAESFILQTPPSGRQFSRHIVSPTNVDSPSNGVNTPPSVVGPMSGTIHKQDLAASSPPYNRLNSNPYDSNGVNRNSMSHVLGGARIDMPDSGMIQTGIFHSSTSNVPNGSISPPVDHLSPRQHTQLHTSLSKLSQPVEGMNGVRSGKQYSESVVSERHVSTGSPPQQLLEVSKSTPMISSRNSFDSTLDSMPASYMTDV